MTHTSVKETQRLIDSAEFAEWWALYLGWPWADEWERTAKTIQAIENHGYGYKRRCRSWEKLVPGEAFRRLKQSGQAVFDKLLAFAEGHNRAAQQRAKRRGGK